MLKSVLAKFDNDVNLIKKELKNVQCQKHRIKRNRHKSTYKTDLTACLQYEELLKQARELLNPRKKFTTELTEKDVEKLSYEETIKAIRSIQSKKTNTKYLTEKIGESEEYKKAVKIEELLLEHKAKNMPVDKIEKLQLQEVIEQAEQNDLTAKEIIKMLKKMLG